MRSSKILVYLMVVVASSQAQNCGKRKVSNLLILGGTEAKEGFWPWFAALLYYNHRSFKYVCGGNILNKNLILTVAHCVRTPNGPIPLQKLSVQVGRSRLHVASFRAQEHKVKELIIHPEYGFYKHTHDIALIRLATDITYTDCIQPICLWNRGEDLQSIVGFSGTVIGIGYDESYEATDTLREARIPVVHEVKCIQNNLEIFGKQLTTEIICAGNRNGVGPCNGDSGSGLYFDYNDVCYIRGLTSTTTSLAQLCDPEAYAVFTDVAKYLRWIKQYMDTKSVASTSLATQVVGCGKRKVFNVFFHSGTVTQEENWPWHVALFVQNRRSFDYKCAGTILNQNTILTVAHCVMTSKGPMAAPRIQVQVGLSQLYVGNKHAQNHDVEKLIVHPEYNLTRMADNIALIKLITDITYTDYIRPVCLWNRGDDVHTILGTRATVIGFGYDDHDEPTGALRKAPVSVVDYLLCMQRDRTKVPIEQISNMFCAGNRDGVDACNDETGGGLFFNYDGVWYIRGMMSFPKLFHGSIICNPKEYTFVTDVAKYLSWIAKHLGLSGNLPTSVQSNSHARKPCQLRC